MVRCNEIRNRIHEEKSSSELALVFLNDHIVIRKRTEDTIVALHPESIQGIEISQGTDV